MELRDTHLEKTNTNNTKYYAQIFNHYYSQNPHRSFDLVSRSLQVDLRSPISHHHTAGFQTNDQDFKVINNDRTSTDNHPIADDDALDEYDEFLLDEDQRRS